MSTLSGRFPLLAVTALLPLAYAASTFAADEEVMSEVVVTGTRVADRSRLDTISPVDVLQEKTFRDQGTTELATSLANIAPSLNFPRPAATDGSDSIRPVILRGLSPDQALVLVDSKRRHASALVNLNGTIGRGSAAVDLNALPQAAIDRVEVLRDGASAEYGSDAIAGVINLHLREANHGGAAEISYGEYDTDVDTYRGSRHEHDGGAFTASAWTGLELGKEGFLTLTGEYRGNDPTNRADYDVRAPLTQPTITARYGDPSTINKTFYANAGLPLSGDWQLYGWAGFQDRDSQSAALPRLANNANNVPAIFPNGFLPLITPNVKDYSAAAGTRGKLGEWDADISLVYGRNKIEYGTIHTVNSTYGAASPTRFDDGALIYDQLVFNAGVVRGFDWGLPSPVNVALGAEARRETYKIEAGEPASYNRGPVTTAGLSPGAQGFSGLQPSNEVDEDRSAYSVYADLESQLTEKFLASVAARGEHYTDFGSTVTGKISGRYDFTHAFALRGTIATGFRAPSLQQEFFTSTATVFTNGIPADTGTFPATSTVAKTLGSKDLEPEKSRNYSLGAVFRTGAFEATLDAYQIEIRNRIVLSENLSSPAVTALLAPFAVTQARFFINGVETRTRGVDAVLHYLLETDNAGKFDFTGAANVNSTDVLSVKTGTSTLPGVVLFSRQNQLRYEDQTPKNKFVLGSDWTYPVSFGALGVNLRGTRYGKVLSPGTAADGSLDFHIASATVVDLSVHADIHDHWTAAVGADNLLDKYPTKLPPLLNTTGATGFSQFSPFGFNGRFVYARLGYKW